VGHVRHTSLAAVGVLAIIVSSLIVWSLRNSQNIAAVLPPVKPPAPASAFAGNPQGASSGEEAGSQRLDRSARAACPDASSDEYYFAPGDLGGGPNGDAFRRSWYSTTLRAMSEPSLSCGSNTGDETFRFLWLRSFRPPIVVVVTRSGARAELRAMELAGRGGQQPSAVKWRISRTLTRLQWEELSGTIGTRSFWGFQTTQPQEIPLVNDGAQWILEGRQGNRYHVVDRQTPPRLMRAVAEVFLKTAGVSLPPPGGEG
jgi:hypothetical protein